MAGSTFWFLEAAPVSVRFRAAEAESGWAAALVCLAEAHSLAPVADFHEPVDDFLSPVAGFHAPVAGSPWQAVDSRERVDGLAAASHEPEVDSLGWAGELAVDSPVQVADSLARADEPGVELPVPVADFRELAAPSGSLELARSHALAVDCRVPLVSPVVLRSAYLAALPEAFLLRAAAADWLAALRLCSPAALERAWHSTQCETRSVWVSFGQRELLEPTEPSSLRLVCLQAFPEDAPMASQEHWVPRWPEAWALLPRSPPLARVEFAADLLERELYRQPRHSETHSSKQR